MRIQGEMRSAKVAKKIEENGRETIVVDFRIKVPMNVRVPVRELMDIAGVNVIVDVEKAQLSLGDQ